ncbi:transglutaminase-like domain-containing protein [Rhodovulum visakhapatnamense]|uniref:Transglutaminase domain-containing protein n=1 Tax=Rhodovulum visakhapatnamense TaxID=364297 RepID=A0ABS1RG64_9RHOB|nr:transglutaminase domain-containing protein [Rhodovulum visakhapatnamense]MBL3570778.1 transglutaminase domain-containing protein [Rhodovulum visakhapatnamense]MBL3578635.1 transglutaminase domain-containing protein [Rhodovulum visakhapatnamense]
MTMKRRAVLAAGAAMALGMALPRPAAARFAPEPSGWRRFEITTRLAIPRVGKPVRAWVPVPAMTEGNWMQAGAARWTTNAQRAGLKTDGATGARFVEAVWSAADAPAELEVTAVASAQDRAVDLSRPQDLPPLPEAERARHTAPTALIPTDGIVYETAMDIVGDAGSDLEKARRIYDWVVDSTERNPRTRGCGLGDVASMLKSGDLTGKCADLNALFVGLARAAGLPARDLYGLRVAPSAFGYKSLGAGSSDVTKAQHCRADVYLDGFGWVPADPADVRKVVLEEPPKTLTLADPAVQAVRSGLFGAWEGNWIALNAAHDVTLPGSANGPLPFLMYPQAESDGRRRDELEPSGFAYTITVRELGA